jgi:CHASE2 domain-containing sensor protein
MNGYDKIRSFCRKFRIIIGLLILTVGFLLGDGSLNLGWWWLGLIPLIAGIINFCPICIISKKCTLKK